MRQYHRAQKYFEPFSFRNGRHKSIGKFQRSASVSVPIVFEPNWEMLLKKQHLLERIFFTKRYCSLHNPIALFSTKNYVPVKWCVPGLSVQSICGFTEHCSRSATERSTKWHSPLFLKMTVNQLPGRIVWSGHSIFDCTICVVQIICESVRDDSFLGVVQEFNFTAENESSEFIVTCVKSFGMTWLRKTGLW